jgi:hypothetical protein
LESVDNLREAGIDIGKGIGFIRFLPATNNYEALVRIPASLFQEYTPDNERMYERGEVLKMPGDNVSKYLLTGDGRIQTDRPPPENSLCRLFRHSGRFEWVREEYCSRGFERHYTDPNNHERMGWYRVTANNAGDNNTPPPNIPHVWERLDN